MLRNESKNEIQNSPIKKLLNLVKIDPDLINLNEVLGMAIYQRDFSAISELVKAGVSLEQRVSWTNFTPLMNAIIHADPYPNPELIKCLLENGADANARLNTGSSLIILGNRANEGMTPMMLLMLKLKHNLTYQENIEKSIANTITILSLLIKYKANVLLETTTGKTVLSYCPAIPVIEYLKVAILQAEQEKDYDISIKEKALKLRQDEAGKELENKKEVSDFRNESNLQTPLGLFNNSKIRALSRTEYHEVAHNLKSK